MAVVAHLNKTQDCVFLCLDAVCKTYVEAVLALPAMQEWVETASLETEIIPAEEIYSDLPCGQERSYRN